MKITIEADTMADAYQAFRTLWDHHNRLQDEDHEDKRHGMVFMASPSAKDYTLVWGTYERPKASRLKWKTLDAE